MVSNKNNIQHPLAARNERVCMHLITVTVMLYNVVVIDLAHAAIVGVNLMQYIITVRMARSHASSY